VAQTHVRPNPAGIAALREHIVRIHRSVVHDVWEDAWTHCPVDTGELRSTIRTRPVKPLLSRIVVGSDHWQPQEYGALAHVIRPKTPGGALFWPGAPHPVNVVHHPGNVRQSFMRPALYQRRSLAGRPTR